MGSIDDFPKEKQTLLTKKDPKSLGYLNILFKLFCRYALKPMRLCGIWIETIQGI